MIISFKNNFIFLKSVKTAGSSIECLLSSICGDSDIITMLNPIYIKHEEDERYKLSGKTFQNCKNLRSHSSIYDAKKSGFVLPMNPDIYFVKRNPYNVAISYINWIDNMNSYKNKATLVNMDKMCFKRKLLSFTSNIKNEYINFNSRILNGADKFPKKVKFIRYENLIDDIKSAFKKYNLNYDLMPRFKTPVNPYKDINDILDEECISIINEKFRFDFEYFGYEMIKV